MSDNQAQTEKETDLIQPAPVSPATIIDNSISKGMSVLVAIVGATSFNMAFLYPNLSFLIALFFAATVALTHARPSRFLGFLATATSLSCTIPLLFFFYSIFSGFAVFLWIIISVFYPLFISSAAEFRRLASSRYPLYSKYILAVTIPFLWLGIELIRTEYWPLKFTWTTPGVSLIPETFPFDVFGVYGSSLAIIGFLSIADSLYLRRGLMAMTAFLSILIYSLGSFQNPVRDQPLKEYQPLVAGIQIENEGNPLAYLEILRNHVPDADIYVLPELAFVHPDGIPLDVRQWCDINDKYLIAGGLENYLATDEAKQTRNVAFVIGPDGEIAFSQAKSVPVQFIESVRPANEWSCWDSPWGKIGIAICYDLGFRTVMDRYAELGARALIIPTLDSEKWGLQQHKRAAVWTSIRSKEYGIPVFRLASSGISQHAEADGRVIASAPYPGHEAILQGRLDMSNPSSIPYDRFLFIPSIIVVAGVMVILILSRIPFHSKTPFKIK